MPSPAFLRFMRSVSTLMLLLALGGGLMLMLRGDGGVGPDPIDFEPAFGPGTVMIEPAGTIGPDPFTAPVAVDFGLDLDLLALPPTSASALESPHGRNSLADRIMVDGLAWELAAVRGPTGNLAVGEIRRTVQDHVGADAAIEGLEDLDGDRRDDDRRFTLVARDGSAVCVEPGPERTMALAQGLAVDPEDGASVSGIGWDPHGPCLGADTALNSPVRVGSNPGVYGAAPNGEVCDLDRLAAALGANPRVGRGWAAVHDVPFEELSGYLASLTPVVLLDDTLVTNHGWRNGTILHRQSVLQRGTAVLIDPQGAPAARCLSGSPLRSPRELPNRPIFQGRPWDGFLGADAVAVTASSRAVEEFVLVDILAGEPITRGAGIEGALASLAGPVVGFEG
ncbi:MAG: DUF6777 domain-containing protein [Acidimicrobiia bacterium]|nr:DUF6777 domain-containing protein [Acidimicrobiia bacterium]